MRTRLPLSLWIAAAIEFAVLAVLAVARTKLWTYGADTGTFAQIVAGTFGGMRDGFEGGSHFRYHWSPSLALLWPLVALPRSALWLQLFQAAATVACAPLVALLALPYANAKLARNLGMLTLLYPPLLSLGFDEFHELGLFAALVLALFVSADRRKWWWFGACAVVATGIREDAALTLVGFGIALVLVAWRPAPNGDGLLDGNAPDRRGMALAGALLALAAGTSFAVYYAVVAPRLGGWVPGHFYAYPFANGPFALLVAPFVHPIAFAKAILTFGRLTYVLEGLVPLAFLPLRSRWALLALPGAAVVLLANSGYVWRMGDHYAALWIPWLLVATVAAAAALARRRGAVAANRWTAAAATLCAIVLIAFDPMHPLHYLHSYYPDLADARRAIGCVPKSASLSTYDEWFSAVAAQRPLATADRTDGVTYLVYARDFTTGPFSAAKQAALAAAVARGAYHPVCRFGAVVAYRASGTR